MMGAKDKVDLIVEQYPEIWKTRSAFFAFIKGVLRRGWNHAPQKLILLKKLRKQIPNPNPKGNKLTVWGAECSVCSGTFPLKEIQVDHLLEETAHLTEIEHIQSCAEKLLLVVEDDLRLVCKGCHSIISLAQKLGMTFDEAAMEKKVIAFKKLSATEQRNVLQNEAKCETISSTIKGRTEQYRQWLIEKEKQNV